MRLKTVIGVLLLGTTLLAQADRTAPRLTAPAVITRNPNPAVPLAAVVTFSTNEPAMTGIELNGSGLIRRVETQATRTHVIPVVGMTAETLHTIRITLTDAAGNVNNAAARLEYTTPPLPADFPPLRAAIVNESTMEPGFTVFPVAPGIIVAVNGKGEVVWYYRGGPGIGALSQTPRGTILFLEGTSAVEIDILGNRISRWYPTNSGSGRNDIPLATNLLHHEILELPGGNLLTLSHEVRPVIAFPSSETDAAAPSAPAALVGDRIVEFTRSGRVVHEWSLLNILDTQRIGYDSLAGFWDSTYRSSHGPTRDWTHANSVSYDVRDDSFVVSLRSLDAVVKVNRADGKLVWIFGTPDGWNAPWDAKLLRGPEATRWPYHQHAAAMTSRGTLLLFDNGNYQARPFSPKQLPAESYSRAVEYAIDATGRLTSEVWSYGGPGDELFFSGTLGGAEMLATTGNVLVTDGARETGTSRWARIVEVTHTKPARKVFELIVGDPAQPAGNWNVYRATRIASFYPPFRNN
jgi:arylsulfate sulfotransferase